MKLSLKLMPVLLFLLSSCASTHNRTDEKEITLSQIKNFSVGHTTKDEVRNFFGVSPMQLESVEKHSLVWLYFLKPPGYQRLSLEFDATSGLLQSMAWFIKSHDRENKIEVAKALFPKANFITHTVYNQIADSFDIIKSLDDEKIGVSIYLGSNDQGVTSIAFYEPGLAREYKDQMGWKPKENDYKVVVDNYSASLTQTVQSEK